MEKKKGEKRSAEKMGETQGRKGRGRGKEMQRRTTDMGEGKGRGERVEEGGK